MQEIVIGKNKYTVAPGKSEGEVVINGSSTTVDLVNIGNGHYHMILEGQSISVEVVETDGKAPQIKIDGRLYQPEVKGETDLLLERLGLNISSKKAVKELKAPMPGLVLEIRVEPGQAVKEGDPLVVLEAMKMENVLKAPGEAVVKSIAVKKGDAIDKNAILIAFE
jgi:acetyl/propionyl-CoA carboxylase alpha subunit